MKIYCVNNERQFYAFKPYKHVRKKYVDKKNVKYSLVDNYNEIFTICQRIELFIISLYLVIVTLGLAFISNRVKDSFKIVFKGKRIIAIYKSDDYNLKNRSLKKTIQVAKSRLYDNNYSLHRLNIEELTQILLNLPTIDLYRFLTEIAEGDKILKTRFNSNKQQYSLVLQEILKRKDLIPLGLNRIGEFYLKQKVLNWITLLAEYLTNLNFSFRSANENDLYKIGQCSKNLTELSFHSFRVNSFNNSLIKELPSSLISLVINDASKLTDSDFGILPKNLKSLSINYCRNLTDTAIQKLPPKLEHLRIDYEQQYFQFSQNVLRYLPKTLLSLEALNWSLTNNNVFDLPPLLKKIFIQSFISDDHAKFLPLSLEEIKFESGFPPLSRLSLKN